MQARCGSQGVASPGLSLRPASACLLHPGRHYQLLSILRLCRLSEKVCLPDLMGSTPPMAKMCVKD